MKHGDTIDITYPSWVPRWDIHTDGIEILTMLPSNEYRSSANMEHTLRISSRQADHLTVEGVRFSAVSSTSEVITTAQFPQLNANRLTIDNVRAIASSDRERGSIYPTGDSMLRAYVATFTAGRLGHIKRESASLPDEPRWTVTTALRACYGRRQFVTENRYIGIGPAAMKKGDVVCVLFGGCVPYVLRETDTDGLYRVVGESYVHGIMRGEVIERWRREEFAKDRFILC